jgi:hypothetical protein
LNKEEFLAEMRIVLEFYDKRVNKTQARIWFEMFSKFSVEVFSKAIKKHLEIDDQNFFPAPAKILKLAEAICIREKNDRIIALFKAKND